MRQSKEAWLARIKWIWAGQGEGRRKERGLRAHALRTRHGSAFEHWHRRLGSEDSLHLRIQKESSSVEGQRLCDWKLSHLDVGAAAEYLVKSASGNITGKKQNCAYLGTSLYVLQLILQNHDTITSLKHLFLKIIFY